MRLYSSVEEIVTICSVKKHGGMGALIFIPCCRLMTPPPPPPPPPQMKKKSPSPGVGFFCQNKLTRELKIRSVGSVL